MDAPDNSTPTPVPDNTQQPVVSPPAAPAPSGPTQPTATAPPPVVQQVAHDSLVGRVAKTLLGTQNDYQIDPQTGKTVAVPIKEKPGDIFRHIVAGAILGGMAGSKGKDFTSGLTMGGGAEIQDQRTQDQQRLSRAQEQFQNQQKVIQNQTEQRKLSQEDQRLQQQKTQNEAQAAMWNNEMVHQERDFNLRQQEHLDTINHWNDELRDKYENAGGYQAPWPENDKVGNGADLIGRINSGDKSLKPPDGYTMNSSTTVDTTGLQYDTKKGWVNDKGDAVDLKDRTKVSVFFVPQNAGKQVEMVPGSKLMGSFPHIYGKTLDPKRNYPVTLNDYQGMATKESEISRAENTEHLRVEHENNMIAYDLAKTDYSNLNDQLKGLVDQSGPEAKDLRDKMEQSRQLMHDAAESMNPHLRKRAPVPEPGLTGNTGKTSGGSTTQSLGPDGQPLDQPEGGLSETVGQIIKSAKEGLSKGSELEGQPDKQIPVSVARQRAAANFPNLPMDGPNGAFAKYRAQQSTQGYKIIADKTAPVPQSLDNQVGQKLISVGNSVPSEQRKQFIDNSTTMTPEQKTALKQYYGLDQNP